jgi:hypothetical protein
VLRRMLVPNEEEATKRKGKLQDEQSYNLYSSSVIVTIIK